MSSALKSRREELRMTQRALAELLGVSQQTVARWESNDQIPTKHLRDAAVKLGMSVSDFIIDQSAPRTATAMPFPEPPYGTLELSIGGQIKHYPTGWSQVNEVFRNLSSSFTPLERWVQLRTLDQRVLYINVQAIDGLRWIDDAQEEMPSFEHEEIYKAAKEIVMRGVPEDEEVSAESYPYSTDIVSSVRSLIDQSGEIETYRWLTAASYLSCTGEAGVANLTIDLICTLDELLVGSLEAGKFVDLTSDDESLKLIPARRLALVELPYLEMEEHLQHLLEENESTE